MLTIHSLDFSDDSVSTTTGRPSAWTIRYSAPEVLDSEPRNRASDIFSLGCVLIEMVSGLHGHNLSEVKDHWKRIGNGQSSFARNPEATSSWLALLSNHFVNDRLKAVIEFLPSLLVTKRLDRPSARAVIRRLTNLSIVMPELPHLVNTCCGPSPMLVENLHPERITGSGLPKTRDPRFWSDIKSYFDAVADTSMTYVVLDSSYNQVAAKHDCYLYLHECQLDERYPRYIDDVFAIEQACAMLFLESTKSSVTLDQSQSQTFLPTTFDHKQVLLQMLQQYESWQVIFTALRTKVRPPQSPLQTNVHGSSQGLSMMWQMRTIQISMVSHDHCLDGESYFNYVFYVLAFNISQEGYEPSKLGAPFVDLSGDTVPKPTPSSQPRLGRSVRHFS